MRKRKTLLSRIKKALCQRQQNKELQRRSKHNLKVATDFYNSTLEESN